MSAILSMKRVRAVLIGAALLIAVSLSGCSDGDGMFGGHGDVFEQDAWTPSDLVMVVPDQERSREDDVGFDEPDIVTPPEVVVDAVVVADVAPGEDIEDISEPPLPDHLPPACIGNPLCPEIIQGTPDAPVAKNPGAPPALLGGPAPAGDYRMESAQVYLEYSLGGLAAALAEVGSGGNTYATAIFCLDTWRLGANLDLQLSAFGESFQFAQQVFGGGEFAIQDGVVMSDITQCVGMSPGFELPDRFAYQNTGGPLVLEVRIPRDVVQALIDEGGIPMVNAENDLVMHLTFAAVPHG